MYSLRQTLHPGVILEFTDSVLSGTIGAVVGLSVTSWLTDKSRLVGWVERSETQQ